MYIFMFLLSVTGSTICSCNSTTLWIATSIPHSHSVRFVFVREGYLNVSGMAELSFILSLENHVA